jgi:hypothetical protein
MYTINEARNVEEYRAEKAKRMQDKTKKDDEVNSRRYYADADTFVRKDKKGNTHTYQNLTGASHTSTRRGNQLDHKSSLVKNGKDMTKSTIKALTTGDGMLQQDGESNEDYYIRRNREADATLRHFRRHPDKIKESTIFDNIDIV